MKFYLAPMEGITGYIYRNAYHRYFLPMDKYFSPFLVPNRNRSLKSRELEDVSPEHNRGLPLVPQILTNCPEDFIWAAKKLGELGYGEVNLNLGCPSGTVVSKGRGAGFLADPEGLLRFLDAVFSKCQNEISVKTRLGMENPEEFEGLMAIYNRFPIKELIVHPRVREDYYKNTPNTEAFSLALEGGRAPVCYNGDIFSREAFLNIQTLFPGLNAVMLGRGVIGDPALLEKIKGKELPAAERKERFQMFHDAVYEGYQEIMSGPRNTLFKMKELWTYMDGLFEGGERYKKKIRKAERFDSYEEAVKTLLSQCEFKG